AAIWGARAGNGVIVITTKSGRLDQRVQVVLNSNLTVAERPDLFYRQRMSSADFIEVEQTLFARGYYNSAENSVLMPPISPAVEWMVAHRDGVIDAATLDYQLDSLRSIDVRHDVSQHLYRPTWKQQYALNFRGGGARHAFSVSGGFDRI